MNIYIDSYWDGNTLRIIKVIDRKSTEIFLDKVPLHDNHQISSVLLLRSSFISIPVSNLSIIEVGPPILVPDFEEFY